MTRHAQAKRLMERLGGTVVADLRSLLEWAHDFDERRGPQTRLGGLNFTLPLVSLVACEVYGFYLTCAKKHQGIVSPASADTAPKTEVAPEELQMAKTLVNASTGDFALDKYLALGDEPHFLGDDALTGRFDLTHERKNPSPPLCERRQNTGSMIEVRVERQATERSTARFPTPV
jgi:hypothetical protein